MKRMYKQPETEIAVMKVKTSLLLNVSEGESNGDPDPHAPKPHSTALPVPGGAL